MIVLFAAGIVVLIAATGIVVRAILRDRRELQRWRAERETADALIAAGIAARLEHVNGSLDYVGASADEIWPEP